MNLRKRALDDSDDEHITKSRNNNGEDHQQIKSVCYVEVNDHDVRNVGSYVLTNGKPMFDIAIIFAANINYDISSQSAVLHCNTQVRHVLVCATTRIKYLQDKGIQVLLSILGNHTGAGVCNFPNKESATDFAQQLADLVIKYGLDGVDFDDEYAGYGKEGA